MNQELFFNDKKYVSSKRAAQISGFARDYIGQLCREGRIIGKKIGRNLYVEEKSLTSYVKNNHEKLAIEEGPVINVPVKLLNTEKSHSEEISPAIEVPAPKANFLNLHPTASSGSVAVLSLPTQAVRKAPFSFGPIVERMAAGLVTFSLVIAFMQIALFVSVGIIRVIPETLSVSNLASAENAPASTASFAQNFADNVSYAVDESVKVFSQLAENISGYFSGNKNNSAKVSVTSSQANLSQSNSDGMVVVPTASSSVENSDQSEIEKIKKTFSDQVVVKPDPGGGSGVVKPVFKSGNGEDYLYVMVPIKE